MRFLHTSDWHVGKTLFGKSRLSEQEQVLREIIEISRSERVDCVLVAGDVYDSFMPSAEGSRRFAPISTWATVAAVPDIIRFTVSTTPLATRSCSVRCA